MFFTFSYRKSANKQISRNFKNLAKYVKFNDFIKFENFCPIYCIPYFC